MATGNSKSCGHTQYFMEKPQGCVLGASLQSLRGFFLFVGLYCTHTNFKVRRPGKKIEFEVLNLKPKTDKISVILGISLLSMSNKEVHLSVKIHLMYKYFNLNNSRRKCYV